MAKVQIGGIYRVKGKLVDAHGREIPIEKLPEELRPKGEKKDEAGAIDLPEDFPGRAALLDAGLTTLEAVAEKSRDELIALKGIGEKTADEIAAAIPPFKD